MSTSAAAVVSRLRSRASAATGSLMLAISSPARAPKALGGATASGVAEMRPSSRRRAEARCSQRPPCLRPTESLDEGPRLDAVPRAPHGDRRVDHVWLQALGEGD